MGGRYLAALEISEAERGELAGRWPRGGRRRKRWPYVLGSCWARPMAMRTSRWPSRLGVCGNTVGRRRRRFAEHRIEGRATKRAPGRRAPFEGPGSKRGDRRHAGEFAARCDPLEARAAPAKASGVSISTRSAWSGGPSACNRTGLRRSSCPPTRTSCCRKCATWSDFMSRRLEHAIVLCVDEKSRIQAADRTQPLLAAAPSQAGAPQAPRLHRAMGCTDRCSPRLDIATGKVIGHVLPAPPGRRVPQVPRRGRAQRPSRSRCPHRDGQLRHLARHR